MKTFYIPELSTLDSGELTTLIEGVRKLNKSKARQILLLKLELLKLAKEKGYWSEEVKEFSSSINDPHRTRINNEVKEILKSGEGQ